MYFDFRLLKISLSCTLKHIEQSQIMFEGLPEPPVDIQVEPGPQDGTLLVTWQPSSSITSPSGTLVTGYAVYADGKKVTDVDSPSGNATAQKSTLHSVGTCPVPIVKSGISLKHNVNLVMNYSKYGEYRFSMSQTQPSCKTENCDK